MHLENFVFATRHLTRGNRAKASAEVIQLVRDSLKAGGKIGETGWTVSVSAREQIDAWEFYLDRDGIPTLKAFLAGTDAVSAVVWSKACAEAAAVGQLRPGSARRKLNAPWIGLITLAGMHAGSRSALSEAAGLEIYVAYALLDTLAFEGGKQ